MKLSAVKTRIFAPREDLASFVLRHVPRAEDGSVLAVASKLFALWKGEILPYETLAQKEEFICRESSRSFKTPLAWFTIKDGMVMTNAGIDESNADGKLLFLPSNLYQLAEEVRLTLKSAWKLQKLGLVVTDSMILPLRTGVIAAAVAYAGFAGVKDLRGQADLFGKKLEVTFVNIADSLATAAALCMGEGADSQPLCLIEGAPVSFREGVSPDEIKYPLENDLYTPLFQAAGLIKKRRLT